MYEISNDSRYSYFSIPDEKIKYEQLSSQDCSDRISNVELELKELEHEEYHLNNLYSTCLNDFHGIGVLYDQMSSENQDGVISRISSINANKRKLMDRKQELRTKLEQFKAKQAKVELKRQSHLSNENKQPMFLKQNFTHKGHQDVSSSSNHASSSFTDQSKPNTVSTKIDFWSIDLFNYTRSRILNKHKFLSPGFILGSSCGHYNYTFFNNQSPEEIEVFDYQSLTNSSAPDALASVSPTTWSSPFQSSSLSSMSTSGISCSWSTGSNPSSLALQSPSVVSIPSSYISSSAMWSTSSSTNLTNHTNSMIISPKAGGGRSTISGVDLEHSVSSLIPPPPPPPPTPPLSLPSSTMIYHQQQPQHFGVRFSHTSLPHQQSQRLFNKITPQTVLPFTASSTPAPIMAASITANMTNRIIYVNDIINRSVDSRHVIILRGLPGSGKTTFCQVFKEKEILNNRSAPRILSVDHFFEEEGKFSYDADLEPSYRHELFKLFKRQIDEGFFSVILLDCVNEKVEQFCPFYQYAQINRFQVSILELKVSPAICAKRSENRYTSAQVYQMANEWEETPIFYDKLNADYLLQDASIEDVEMEDDIPVTKSKSHSNCDNEECDSDDVDEEDEDDENFISETGFFKSKWDEDFEDTKERLDGMKQQITHDSQSSLTIKEYLKIEMENLNKSNMAEKTKERKVKWADFEELKKQKRRKELGFVAGNTDWAKLMSSDIDVAEAALVQIRYFTKDGGE